MGKVFKKKKKKPGGGRGENKVPQKKNRDQGKKMGKGGGGGGGGKNFKKLNVNGGGKGKKKMPTWDVAGIEKRILSVHHPSTLVHCWVLVHSGRESGLRKCVNPAKLYCWPCLPRQGYCV